MISSTIVFPAASAVWYARCFRHLLRRSSRIQVDLRLLPLGDSIRYVVSIHVSMNYNDTSILQTCHLSRMISFPPSPRFLHSPL